MISLVCFFFLLQLATMTSIYILETAWLKKASDQNNIDLALMHYAKEMIQENKAARLCNSSNIQTEKSVEVFGSIAYLYDRSTFIEVAYEGNTLVIYYDDTSLYDMEWK
jgi:hypothetical protein